jgi:hypothetical protein
MSAHRLDPTAQRWQRRGKGHQISQEGVSYVLRRGRGSAKTGQMTQRSRFECSCLTRKQTAGELGVCQELG